MAGLVMTAVMLLLASVFGLATPLTIMGDRLSVLFRRIQFLALMGRVGGYNRMKQLGVGSVDRRADRGRRARRHFLSRSSRRGFPAVVAGCLRSEFSFCSRCWR